MKHTSAQSPVTAYTYCKNNISIPCVHVALAQLHVRFLDEYAKVRPVTLKDDMFVVAVIKLVIKVLLRTMDRF